MPVDQWSLQVAALPRSPQLSNQEATEGRVLEIAGIGAEGYFQAQTLGIFTHGEEEVGAYKAQTPLTAIGRARSGVATQPHIR
jgi:hypothetical protein